MCVCVLCGLQRTVAPPQRPSRVDSALAADLGVITMLHK